MEDLRDMNASRVSEYQSMIHQLKGNLVDHEKEYQQERRGREECQEVLFELLGEIELREMRKICSDLEMKNENLLQQELSEKEELRGSLLSEQRELETRYQKEIAEIRERYLRQEEEEKEVRAVMGETLKRLEMNSWEEIGNKVMLLESQLSSSQLESVAREERLSSEREERIRQLTAEHEEQMQRLQEQLEKLQEEYEELKKELQLHLKGEEENTALAGQLSSEIQQRDQSIQLLRGQVVKSGLPPFF
jgi:hypothetical protein